MASLENPNPRETFDKNKTGIAETRQAIAEATASGDYDKVGALAQEAKNMEASNLEMSTVSQEATDDNKAFDEAKAAEKAQKDAERVEQAQLQAEKDSQEVAALLAKLQGGAVESSPTEQVAETNAAEVLSNALSRVEEKFGNVPDDAFVLMKRESPTEVSVTLSDRRYYAESEVSEKLYLPDDVVLKTETGSVTTGSLGALRGLLRNKRKQK